MDGLSDAICEWATRDGDLVTDPQSLAAQSFSQYLPQARKFAQENIAVLRSIPLPLLSILLGQIIDYDKRFPAEQQSLIRQFRYLKAMDASTFKEVMAPFATLQLPPGLSNTKWVNQPRRFNEQLSAALWSTHQIDAFRDAGHRYEDQLADALAGSAPALPRFVIVLIGSKAVQTKRVLFRNLRPHGVLFDAVQPAGALEEIIEYVSERSKAHPEPYAHWYIDGGKLHADCGAGQGITVMSYEELAPFAYKELNLISNFASSPHAQQTSGPEDIQTFMASLRPKDLGIPQSADDTTLHEFQASIFTNGAGTQIFSTTFVQWTAREVLRRAQPLTLLARFCPRQYAASMNTMLRRNPLTQEKDVQGSLIDADMGAYYTWLNLTRLAGSEQARFLVWFEDHELALAISPALAGGTTSNSSVAMRQILRWME